MHRPAVITRVGRASRGFWLWRQRVTIEPVFEDRFNTLVGTRPECASPLAGRFESFSAVAFAQSHDP
jgi:hypothetical protein